MKCVSSEVLNLKAFVLCIILYDLNAMNHHSTHPIPLIASIRTAEKPSSGDVTEKEKEEQRLNLLMVTLKEIGRKTSMMEEMEKDARNMLSRADVLQKRIKNLENMKKKRDEEQRKAAKEKPKPNPLSVQVVSKTEVSNTVQFKQQQLRKEIILKHFGFYQLSLSYL